MRLLVLEDDTTVAQALRQDLEPLGHAVSVAPNVPAAQVALQAERFDVAILSERLLDAAVYSLVDYIRITRPDLRIILVRDRADAPPSDRNVDWMVSPPVSPLEVVQVFEYLLDSGARRPAERRRGYTYAGTPRPAAGGRNWMN